MGNIAEKDFFDYCDIDKTKEYYKLSKTPYISFHIDSIKGNLQSEKEALDVIKENVNKLRKEFNKDIILENVPAFRNRKEEYNFYAKPEFISKVINETNSGFLFDISHARVAADVLNIPFDEYVKRLQMDKLVEIHLAGCMKDSNGLIDANHSKMNEEDYLFLEELLKTSKTLKVVTLEYGTPKNRKIDNSPTVDYGKVNELAKKEIYEQLIRLKEMLEK